MDRSFEASVCRPLRSHSVGRWGYGFKRNLTVCCRRAVTGDVRGHDDPREPLPCPVVLSLMLAVGVHGQPGTSGVAGERNNTPWSVCGRKDEFESGDSGLIVRPPSAYAARTVAYEGATGAPLNPCRRVCMGIAHPVQPGGSGIVAPFELADWAAGAGCAVIGVDEGTQAASVIRTLRPARRRTASGGRRQACRRSA